MAKKANKRPPYQEKLGQTGQKNNIKNTLPS